jgi:uncharacterized protein involved in exopolysaccharide biosynthesis
VTIETQQPQYYDDVIDLRAYILVLVRFWPVIVGMVLVAVLAAVGLTLSRPTVYEATAAVVITESRAEISFVPEFRTTSQGLPANADARRNALIGLVKNPAIANKVIATLGDRLPPALRSTTELVEAVEGTTTGDLITISVRTEDPAVAMAIANAWGAEYERHVNQLYGIVVESAEAVRQQAERAKDDYDTAQSALVAFTGANRIAELQMAIAETEQTLDAAAAAQVESRLAAFVGEHNEGIESLAALHATRRRLVRLLEDARALETQLATAGNVASPSDAVALTLLKAQVYAWPEPTTVTETRPIDLQFQIGSADAAPVRAEDVHAVTVAIEARIASLDAAIATWQQGQPEEATLQTLRGGGALDAVIAPLHEELRSLQAQLEAEKATLQELTQTRDLAWETYTTVARKVAELNVGAAVQGTVVRLAAPAALPTEPVSRQLVQTVALAGAVAFMLAVGVAFVTNLLHPDADPSAALKGRRPRAAALQ